MSEIERLPSSSFAPRGDLLFEDVFGLHALFDKLAFKSNLILSGPKGIGKSLAVASFGAKNKCPVLTCDCSEDMRRSHLLGSFVLRGNATPFVLGPLATAFEVANEVGSCILCLEECNALSPQLQKVLNPVTDFRRRVEIPEAKLVCELKGDARLWVVGTMNTAVYGGVYALNEDLKSRFRILALGYPGPDAEHKIVNAVLSGTGVQLDKDTINHVLQFAKDTRAGNALEYAFSTRDVIQVLQDVALVGLKPALQLALGKFEDNDRSTVKERIRSIFGLTLILPGEKTEKV